ncbi:MAG: corrinoid protein [Oscillospiraceae bacterium]|nr:corrinoid protein [Oscillospiraceae bacterium]
MTREQELHQALSDAVLDMDEDLTEELAKKVIEEGFDAYAAIDAGLADGMERAGVLFEDGEYFVPELILCADAMYRALDVLKPHIKVEEQAVKPRAIIGVVEGDTHDIGKNLVRIMTEAGGFEIIDIGRDVPPNVFIDRAIEENAEIIMISTLMTTTMTNMAKVIELLNERGLRDKFKVMVGGGPISQAYADRIGADGYSKNAAEAVRLAKSLLGMEVAK